MNGTLVIPSVSGILLVQVVCKYTEAVITPVVILVQFVAGYGLADFHPGTAVAHSEFSQPYFSN